MKSLEELKELWELYSEQNLSKDKEYWDGMFCSEKDYLDDKIEDFFLWLQHRPDLLPVI